MSTTTSDRGGPAGAAVDAFYERLHADAELVGAFDGTQLAGLRAYQRSLLSMERELSGAAFAGRLQHPGLSRLAVDDRAFPRVIGHLGTVLTELPVTPRTAARIVAVLRPVRAGVAQVPLALVR